MQLEIFHIDESMFKNTKASFDFDGVLTRATVQEYVKGLLDENIEVFIVTSRFDNFNLHRYDHPKWRLQGNDDLYDLIYELGIPVENVVFTNMTAKSIYFKNNPDFAFHLDDDILEIININTTQVPAIEFNLRSWKNKCDKILNKLYASN